MGSEYFCIWEHILKEELPLSISNGTRGGGTLRYGKERYGKKHPSIWTLKTNVGSFTIDRFWKNTIYFWKKKTKQNEGEICGPTVPLLLFIITLCRFLRL